MSLTTLTSTQMRRAPTASSRPRPAEFIAALAGSPCCPAVTTDEQFDRALLSHAEVLFVLRANGLELSHLVRRAHDQGKLVAVHLDLLAGLRSDRGAVGWLARSGADAVITSHGHLVAAIKNQSMVAVQRLLAAHRSQLAAGLASIARSEPDVVEFLPGVVLPQVRDLAPRSGPPMLAGGFVRTQDDVRAILAAGALAVTTSREDLWSMSRE
jgi:glycerol uptake operon antiterminator